jgi:hypothetical protein
MPFSMDSKKTLALEACILMGVCVALLGAPPQDAKGNAAGGPTQANQLLLATPEQLWTTKSFITGISADGKRVVGRNVETAGVIIHDVASGETRTIADQHRAVSGPHEALGVAMSLDGMSIAFVVGPTFLGPWELRLIRSDGSDERTIFRSERAGGLRPLAWSTDSKGLLCLDQGLGVSMTEQKNNLVMLDVQTGSVRAIATELGLARQSISGAISPDGRFVAYSSGMRTQIFSVVDASETPVLNAGGPESRVLGWLHNSKDLIIGSGQRGPGSFGIYRIRIHEGKAGTPELLKGQLDPFDAIGIDASGTIYYDLQHHGLMNAYTATLETADGTIGLPIRVTSAFENLNAIPVWSPDGKKFAWIGLKSAYVHMDGGSITVRDVTTGRETTAAIQLSSKLSMPQWMPSPAWMSDNRHMLMMAVDDDRYLSLFKVDPVSGATIRAGCKIDQ